jgi:hypothetical protein
VLLGDSNTIYNDPEHLCASLESLINPNFT